MTNKYDVTTDFVVDALRRRKGRFIRLNTEDLVSDWRLNWENDGAVVNSSSLTFRPRDATSVYYRRPKSPRPPDGTSPDAGPFAIKEGRALLRNLLACIGGSWVSPIAATEAAENKLLQLDMAQRLGLRTPRTLVTNDPVAASKFLAGYEAVVVKPLSNGWLTDEPPRVAFTSVVTGQMVEVLSESILSAPHLLQERIEKDFDVRVTVVGDSIFACRIHSQEYEETQTDFRAANAFGLRLKHELISLPQDISDKCIALVQALGLRFGAIDLVRDCLGYVFLEINPNGQWAWIEQLTGAPIAAAIADLLLGSGNGRN